jgi:hypothetical protein
MQPIPLAQLTAKRDDAQIVNELASLALRNRQVRETAPRSPEVQKIDHENTLHLVELLTEIGSWPTIARFGREIARAAWLVALSANDDPAQQADFLRQMSLLPANDVDLADRAYLEDRVRLNGGHPQVYGTIWTVVLNPATDAYDLVPSRLEDLEHVDLRRAAMGLPPLATQEAEMRAALLEEMQGRETPTPTPSPPAPQTQ